MSIDRRYGSVVNNEIDHAILIDPNNNYARCGANNPYPVESAAKVVYSGFQASLDDGSEIDSGWLDMGTSDKVQFSGFASAAGMDMVIDSRAHPSQTPLTTTTNYTAGTFFLYNVICRQRYMRFHWANNTGSTVTNTSMEIKQTYGGSDKMSVFPVSVNPTAFSQAALVQAITRERQPDGDYVNTKADGTVFTTDVSLGADASFTSSWFDSDGWNCIELFIKADTPSTDSGINIDFTDNVGVNTVQANLNYTFSHIDVARGYEVIRFRPLLDGFRISYTNGDTSQSEFFMECDVRANADSNNYNLARALVVADFPDEVALGNVSNYASDVKYGRNPIINTNTDPADIWDAGSEYTGHPIDIGSSVINIASSDSNDTAAGTGARTLRLFGLKTNLSESYESEDIILNGTSDVATANTWYRVIRMYILTAGTGEENAGNITATSVSGSYLMSQINSGNNQSLQACTTIPAGRTMLVKGLKLSIGGGTGATCSFRVRNPGGVFRIIRNYDINDGAFITDSFYSGIVIAGGSDIKLRVDEVESNSTSATGQIEFLLINRDA